jgi:uracil phosphoribosyltransferase
MSETTAASADAPGMPPPVVLTHPLAAEVLTVMRDRATPGPAFRARLRALGSLLLIEAMRDLPLAEREVETPLARTRAPQIARPLPALISVLRAGDGLLAGMLDMLPDAPVGHIGLWRDHATLRPVEYLVKLPTDIAERPVFVADPMLATAGTAVAAIARVKEAGARRIRMLCALAAPEGVATLGRAHPDVALFIGALDERLDERGYIVPGLGDAGDRLFGTVGG